MEGQAWAHTRGCNTHHETQNTYHSHAQGKRKCYDLPGTQSSLGRSLPGIGQGHPPTPFSVTREIIFIERAQSYLGSEYLDGGPRTGL